MIKQSPLSGRFYRITFATDAQRVLGGVIHPEGRFHHDAQPAFYCSPTKQAAAAAVSVYLGPDDPPRMIIPLDVINAKICDLRDTETCAALGIDLQTPSVPWAPQRAQGIPATSWQASDAVREIGADGMIYTCRRQPRKRWHIVLFRWNHDHGAQVRQAGDPQDFAGI